MTGYGVCMHIDTVRCENCKTFPLNPHIIDPLPSETAPTIPPIWTDGTVATPVYYYPSTELTEDEIEIILSWQGVVRRAERDAGVPDEEEKLVQKLIRMKLSKSE